MTTKSQTKAGMQKEKSKGKRTKANTAELPAAELLHCQACGAQLREPINQFHSTDGRKVLCIDHFLGQFGAGFAADLRKKLEDILRQYGENKGELEATLHECAEQAGSVRENETLLKLWTAQQKPAEDLDDLTKQVQRERWKLSQLKSSLKTCRARATILTNKARDLATSAIAQYNSDWAKLQKWRNNVPNYKIP